MRRGSCFLQFIFLMIFSYSQKTINDQDAPNSRYPCLSSGLKNKSNSNSDKLPFGSVKIIDARADTSKIGFFYNASAVKMMRLCFKQSATSELSDFFTSFFKNNVSESNRILIVNLRRLWVGAYDSSLNGKYSKKNLSIIIRVEFLINEFDNYYPLYRFDSSIVIKTANNEVLLNSIEEILIRSTYKISKVFNPERVRPISYHMLDSFNNTRINYTIAVSDSPKKGVYLNFAQFRNNSPAYPQFELKFGKHTDEIYVKGVKGSDSLISDAWGFSDGIRPFIRMKYNYFPLFKSGNNYDMYGPTNLVIIQPFKKTYPPYVHFNDYNYEVAANMVALGLSTILDGIRFDIKKFAPFQLDLETGQLF